MPRRSFKDRFLTPPVARALVSPSGILLAGAGAAVALAAGLPLLAAPVVGGLAYGARVLAAVPRSDGEHVDPDALPEPWRRFPAEALDAERRFDDAVRTADAGPLRERLEDIGDRMADGVQESWRIAKRGAQLTDARSRIDTITAKAQLRKVQEDAGEHWARGSDVERTAEALRAQLATADRLDAVIADTRSRLELLDARLDEAVARAIELSVRTAVDIGDPKLAGLGADVDDVVSEMESLRQALEETDGRPGTATGA